MDIEPGIFRPEFPMDANFTMVPNALIRDRDLGATAKLLLIYLLSHKIGYQIRDDQIIRESGLGRHALRSARKELEEAGFIALARMRNADQSLGTYHYEIADPKGYFSTVELSTVEYSTVELPTVENRPDNRKPIPKKTKVKKTNGENTGNLDDDFETFWKVYPKKADKALAKRSFEKALGRTTLDVILAGAERYRHDPNREEQFTKNASTWLNADAWDNPPLPAPTRKRANWEDAVDLARKYREPVQQQIEYVNEEAVIEIEATAVSWLKGIDDD